MKKILFSLMALVCCMGIDAQVVKLMKDGNVVATYNASQVDDVLFVEEDTHEYVDLNLPSGVKWATCNVGAATPEDFGLYFAWGETTGYTNHDHSYSWANYKWTIDSSTTLIKYNPNTTSGTVDNRAVLDLIDDAANVFWGGSWRIPSQTEWTELKEQCDWTWDDTKKGYKVASKTNAERFIFLPAAGYYEGNNPSYSNVNAYYWSSTLNTSNPVEAYSCCIENNNIKWMSNSWRYYGQTVRPVFK